MAGRVLPIRSRVPLRPRPPLRGAVLAVLLLTACQAPPLSDLEAARAAMRRADAAEGAVRAPGRCAAARTALLHAEAESRLQGRRHALSRNYDRAREMALEARRAAESCALEAAAVRDRTRRRAERGVRDLEGSIVRARALARHLPPRHEARRRLLRAELGLGEARGALERHDYERAVEALERGKTEVVATIRSVDAFFERVANDPRRSRWARWVKETLRESRRSGRPAILVDKLRRQLLVIRGDDEIASYDVDLGISGITHKVQEGDEATPEGRYRITEVRGPGQTRYYRALMLDYPNEEDRANFQRLQRAGRVPKGQTAGGLIEIHGRGGRGVDWTQGCVALDNEDMDDLVPRIRVGTPVTIVGTIPKGALP